MGVSNDRKKRRLKPIGRFLVIFLAFMVTLTTVNALILPAITLNEETAEGEPGIEVADKEPETTPEAEPEQTPESEQEVTEVSETAPEKTAAPEVKEEIKYTAGELVYTEKEGFEITLKYTEEAKLTDKAELQIVEIWERGEYEDYLKKLEEDVYPEEKWEIIDARVFDVHTNETEEIKGKTEVTFEYLEETVLEDEEELKILVLNDKDEYIELDEKDNKIEIESKEAESKEGSIIESVSFEKKDLDHFVIASVKEKKTEEETKEDAAEETLETEEDNPEDTNEGEAEPEVKEEEKKVLEKKENTYTVTLTYGEDAKIPEGSTLFVREIVENTKSYDKYLERANKEVETITYARFFDIRIMDPEGNVVEPQGKVDVIITSNNYKTPEEAEVTAVHFKDSKSTEVIETADNNTAKVKFEAESFSVYGIIYSIEKTVITAMGDTYTITVTYGNDAGIPEGAELAVREILPEDEEYKTLQQQIEKNLEEGKEDIPSKPALFDISIMYEGQEIEPAEGSEVNVEIKLAGNLIKGKYSDENSPVLVNDEPVDEETSEMDKEIQVIHFKNDDKVDVMKTEDEITDQDVTSSFTTDSFSNWLVYLDEDLTDINVTTGDSLTLRPYTEWVWKDEDEPAAYQGGQWTFPSSDWNSWTGWDNGVQYTYYQHKTNESRFRAFSKTDGELQETYTVITSDSLNAGTFDIQTNKGKIIHVHVTQGQSSPKPDTVQGISGLTVNLFDYDVPYVNGQPDFKHSGNLDDSGNKATSVYDQTVNVGHNLDFLGWGYDGDNHGVNSYTKDVPKQGIVKDQLTDGYPVLDDGSNQSLDYLFDTSSHTSSVYAFPDADGLFQQDNQGFYYYNSNSNYAEYDMDNNQFILYEHTYSQNTGGSNGSNAKPFGFFPFHEYDASNNAQPSMNHNKDLNHHFGMSMSVDFQIPKDRQAEAPDGQKHDIIYEFSGDDDLWVFVDDELVLDIGGLHQPVSGSINFTTGEIKVHGIDDITKTFTVGAHTMKMFYLERGGCDSNLSVRFNFPLVKGKAALDLFKKSMTNDDDAPDRFLEGAMFGVWEDAACTGEPYMTATSDASGHIDFGYLPVKNAGQKFYIKEMVPPDGYLLSMEVFTATASEADADGNYTLTITDKDGNEVEKMIQEPKYPIIRDDRPDPIQMTVEKQWKNADGTLMDNPSGTAEFELKRHYIWVEGSSGPANSIINVYRVNRSWQNPRLMVTREYAGNTTADVNWTYNQYLDNSFKNWQYRVNNGSTQTKGNGPASIQLTAGETTNVYIFDGNLGTQYERYGVENITVSGTEPSSSGGEITTGEGEDTEYQGPKVTLPTSGGKWFDTVNNLIVAEEKNNRRYYYQYYFIETDVPQGFEAVYLDAHGNPISDPSTQMTNHDGSQTVVNRKLLDVPIEKHWADAFIGEEYDWNATFQLEYMEVKVNEDDLDAEDAVNEFSAVEGKSLTISKGQTPQPSFNDLPMYKVHSNGTVYRIIYAVDETAYEVKDVQGRTVAKWTKSGGVEVGEMYAPQYEHDAGENGSSIEDYHIFVVNSLKTVVPKRGITLDLTKIWSGNTSIQNVPDAYATFKLKRLVHEEYRDYSNVSDSTEWVDITLDTWGNGTKLQKLHVPKNQPMHIIGSIKGRTNANKIVFSQSSGQSNLELIQDNTQTDDKYLFDIQFTADQPKTITLTQGDNYVVGGRDGFFLSDSYTGHTSDETDSSFEVEFTLNQANSWQEYFDYLPTIEEQDVDPLQTSQTIYVYSYYLEEVSSNPSNYSAVFTDSNGTKLGDINNGIDTDAQIRAENKLSAVSITLKKVDKANVNKENLQASDLLDGATFILEKYTQLDPETADTEWNNAHNIAKAGNNGVFEFNNLPFGIYKIVEQDYPTGYIQTTEAPVFELKQDTNGNPVIEILNPSDLDGLVRVIEIDGELVIIVGNESGTALPHTGGSGTTIFYTLGSILVLIASAWLFQNKKSYRRGGGRL